MNLSDITKINFGSAGISAVYNGGIKLWPKQVVTDNKVMKFTTTDGNTWDNTELSAYTADNRLIQPIKKDATGWTYDEDVEYLSSNNSSSSSILTFEGFPKAVKIKNAAGLFYNCINCTDISTANIDTSECTNMNSIFNNCRGLTSLDVSNFDTSQVTNMGNMFTHCRGLTTLDVSNWNTSKVTNMFAMFNGCMGLTSLDLSNFNTSQVPDMSAMFTGCRGLTSLDLSNWDMTKVTNTNSMFLACSSLKTVKMTNCSQPTKDKIRAALDAAGLKNAVITE